MHVYSIKGIVLLYSPSLYWFIIIVTNTWCTVENSPFYNMNRPYGLIYNTWDSFGDEFPPTPQQHDELGDDSKLQDTQRSANRAHETTAKTAQPESIKNFFFQSPSTPQQHDKQRDDSKLQNNERSGYMENRAETTAKTAQESRTHFNTSGSVLVHGSPGSTKVVATCTWEFDYSRIKWKYIG